MSSSPLTGDPSNDPSDDQTGRLVIQRHSIEEQAGRDFDLREIQINMISIAGNVDESDDEFVLEWKSH